METALAYPSSKPAALMQHFQDKFSPALLRDIQRELHLLDDSLNVELEFAGARIQLMESHQQKSRRQLLKSQHPTNHAGGHDDEQHHAGGDAGEHDGRAGA